MKLWRSTSDQPEKSTRPGRVLINKERCKGCGYCAEFCPKGVLKMSEELNPKGYYLPAVVNESECVSCGLCEMLCPDFAIHVVTPNSNED